MGVTPFINLDPDQITPGTGIMTGEYADVFLLRGDELEGRPLPNTQGLDGVDGSETFEDFEVQDPITQTLPGNDLGGNIKLSNWTEWWNSENNAEFSNSKCAIKKINGSKYLVLNGLRDSVSRWGNASTKPTIGPAAAFFPIKSSDLDWQILRIGCLVAYDSDIAPGDGGFRFGLSRPPTPQYEYNFLGTEMQFSNLAFNIGNNRWDTGSEDLRGRYERVESAGAPDYGPNNSGFFSGDPATGYFRWLGEAGVSVFPLIIEFSQVGTWTRYDETNLPPVYGADAQVLLGVTSGAQGINHSTFENMMKAEHLGIAVSGFGYKDIHTLSDSNSEALTWADYNHILIESFFPNFAIQTVAYQVIQRQS